MSNARIFLLAELTFVLAVFGVAVVKKATDYTPPQNMPAVLVAFRTSVVDAIGVRFSEPRASIVSGLLLGADENLPKSVRDQFRASGLAHILAVSGYNTTILATLIESLLVGIGFGRRTVFPIVTAVLALFVLLTGAEPSVIRAAIMGFIVMLARRIGRPSHGWYALTFAAAVMALLNHSVLFSVGFQLSFLATAGLMTVGPAVMPRLRFIPERFGIRETAAASVGATVMTAPLVAFRFGTIPMFGVLANLLVVPLVPLTMLVGALALLPFFGIVATLPAMLLVSWMLVAAEWLSHLPQIILSL